MQNEMRDRLVELINNYPCMSTAKDFSLFLTKEDAEQKLKGGAK